MKNLILGTALTVLLASCGGEESVEAKAPSKNENTNQASVGAKYTVDSEASTLKWKGTKLAGDHHGTVTISSGEAYVDNGKLTGGSAVIDVASLNELDAEGEWKEKLEGHLKSADFFNVDSFPTANIVVTSVKDGKATADLTIKGKTKSIDFPVSVKENNGNLTVDAKFTIDRTDWGVVYGSGSFFDLAKDKIISNDISFDLSLVAKK